MNINELMRIPHKGGLIVTIDDHVSSYMTVADYVAEYAAMQSHEYDYWVSDEQRDKAIAEDRLVEVQWYPDTPVGFYRAAGADIEVVVAYALKVAERR